MPQTILTLFFGFILGIKHAFDADHLLAITTALTEQKNPFKAALLGTFWGIGHTLTLFIIGILVLFFNLSIPEKISMNLELLVGIMLIALGLGTITKRNLKIHHHVHKHDGIAHSHLHSPQHHQHRRSFLIGIVHGLAGSATIMILVISTIKSLITGIYYILLFGFGSIIGMTLVSFFIGIPFIYSMEKFTQGEKYIRIIAGSFSIIFGSYIFFLNIF